MKPFRYLIFLKLMLLIVKAELTTNNYAALIADICDIFKPSSVIYVNFDEQQNIVQKNVMFETEILLSKKKIMTLTINFEEIFKVREDTKPMRVFLLKSEQDISKFKGLSNYLSNHKSINFALFVDSDEILSLEFCMKPTGNPFSLNSDTVLHVKCYENPILYAWYPLNRYKIVFNEWAIWEPESKLFLKEDYSIFRQMNGLNGKVIRTAEVQESQKMTIDFFGSVLINLELAANFKTNQLKVTNKYGSWNESSKTWSGAIGLIVNDEVDLLTSGISMTSQRLQSIDFSVPLIRVEKVFWIRRQPSKSTISWNRYFEPFSFGVWVAFILLFIITQVLLLFLKSQSQKDGSKKYFLDNILYVWGIYCQQSLPDFPIETSLRIVYSTISLFAFLMLSIYSACLVSSLTNLEENLPFKNIAGFLKDRSYKLAVIRDSSDYDFFRDTNCSIWLQMRQLMLPKHNLPLTIEEAINMICQNKVVLYATELFLINFDNDDCQFTKISTGHFENLALILRKNSPYTKIINYYVQKFRESGVLNYVYRIIFTKRNYPKVQYEGVTLQGIALLLAILAASIILSLTILIFERAHFRWCGGIKKLHESSY